MFLNDVYIVRDGVQGGTSGAIYCLWQMGDDYDDEISQVTKISALDANKKNKKIFNKDIATKEGQDGYNPI